MTMRRQTYVKVIGEGVDGETNLAAFGALIHRGEEGTVDGVGARGLA